MKGIEAVQGRDVRNVLLLTNEVLSSEYDNSKLKFLEGCTGFNQIFILGKVAWVQLIIPHELKAVLKSPSEGLKETLFAWSHIHCSPCQGSADVQQFSAT